MTLILSGTDGLSDVDGFAATPAIRGTDTSTGIFFPAADTVGITTGGSERARVDSSGNLGLGVTPSAWTVGKTLQISSANGPFFYGAGQQGIWGVNAYYGSGGWTYGGTGYATYYEQSSNGVHNWRIAASGTAGNAITFTQAMTLDASGRLGIGETSPTAGLQINRTSGQWITLCDATSTGNGDKTVEFRAAKPGTSYLNLSYVAYQHIFNAGGSGAEAARIDSSGNLLVGTTSGSNNAFFSSTAQGSRAFQIATSQYGGQNIVQVYGVTSEAGINAGGTAMGVSKNGGTSRSINAAGTINASGADYAEYMTKAGGFTIAKGDVVGINAEGKLTNVFADAISFAVKSTDPSYVGGDTWGNEEALGLTKPDDDATQEEKDAFEAALEAARQLVDRIAFAGQVPVNVTGATAGQYIVPVNDNGTIKGQAVSNPTFEQYQQAVGKVIAIEQDGRARIIVKVA